MIGGTDTERETVEKPGLHVLLNTSAGLGFRVQVLEGLGFRMGIAWQPLNSMSSKEMIGVKRHRSRYKCWRNVYKDDIVLC